MQRKKEGAVEWLTFDLLSEVKGLAHAVFLRRGGVSQGPFGSLNVGGGTGDAPEKILENREIVKRLCGATTLISGMQVHGCDLVSVPSQDPLLETSCDGLLTQKRGIGLMIKHADCQAAIFYDPVHKAIANVHCGWRGNVQNIYRATVEAMRQRIGSKPENLLVCVSPSLGPTWAEFRNFTSELPEAFWEYQRRPTYFDLWEISRMQLEQAGVLPHHIEMAGICTASEPTDFFSYRRDKVTGRHATVVTLI